MEIKYNHYQNAIFDFVRNSKRDGEVIAVAGSGKTTTALASLDSTSCMARVLFPMAGELKNKVPNHVVVSSYNSFGWKYCKQNVPDVKFDQWKTRKIFESIVKDLTSLGIGRAIEKLVSLMKALGIMDKDAAHRNFDQIVNKYDVRIPDHPDFLHYFLETYGQCLANKMVMDYDDQLLFPVKEGWLKKEFDLVVIDDFQDTSVLQIAMMLNVGDRIIAIGDPNQGVYPNALDAIRLPLYICYKCPRAVIDEARKVVPHIEAASDAKTGTVDYISEDRFLSSVREGDFVLCRTIAPLITHCLKMISEGRRAKIKGIEIGESLIDLINKVTMYDCSITEFVSKLNDYSRRNSKNLKESKLFNFLDHVESIRTLAVDCKCASDLLLKIEGLFTDYPGWDYIQFMPVHKSKGLQSNRVFILRPDLMDKEKYIAITRAKSELFFVENKE